MSMDSVRNPDTFQERVGGLFEGVWHQTVRKADPQHYDAPKELPRGCPAVGTNGAPANVAQE